MMLIPGENGYGPLLDLSNRLPSSGKAFPHPITEIATLAQAWPDCPLLHTWLKRRMRACEPAVERILAAS